MPNSTTIGGVSFHLEGIAGSAGGHTSVGAMPRSYQVTPVGPDPVIGTTALIPAKRRQQVSEEQLSIPVDQDFF
jgi:hypothetical protein